MKAKAGKKKVVLELGGNAACIVEDFRCAAGRYLPCLPDRCDGHDMHTLAVCRGVAKGGSLESDLHPAFEPMP